MNIVITYGTFDLFHVGHIRLLKRLKNLGGKLIVGVSTDEFNESKGKKSFFSYNERAEILQGCKYVDDVFPENCWEQKKEDVLKYNVDIFAMGSDWEGKFDFLSEECTVLYLKRTDDISTTEIKQKLSLINSDELDDLETSLHNVISIVKSISTR